MRQDMCVPCGEGLVNLRVGAVIARDGKLLMVGNDKADYLYSVGGRIQFGETAEEAVVREVWEETGVRMGVRRLAFVHENYFCGDEPSRAGKLIYEIAFYFLMDVPRGFEPLCRSTTEGDAREYLRWVAPDAPEKLYPEFFRTDALRPGPGVKVFVTDERRAGRAGAAGGC